MQQVLKTDIHHMWQKLLDEHECLSDSILVYPHEKNLSLIQQRDKLFASIDKVFEKPNESISLGFKLDGTFVCRQLSGTPEDYEFVKMSYIACETKKLDLVAITVGRQECLILGFDNNFTQMQMFRLQSLPGPFTKGLSNGLDSLSFADLQFYNDDVISLLLVSRSEEKSQSYFVQFPLDQVKSNMSLHTLPQEHLNISDFSAVHSIFDTIDSSCFKGMDSLCTHLSVSGCRKVR